MRDVVLTLMILSTLPFIPMSPYLGVLVFNWLSLMQPHRLAYGFAVEAPFAMIVAVLTLLGWMITRESKRYALTPLGMLLLIFTLWITITTALAVSPEIALVKWANTMKTLMIACLVMMLASGSITSAASTRPASSCARAMAKFALTTVISLPRSSPLALA